MIMAMVLGVTIATGEFRHATATAIYLATPHRARVLTAKAIAAFAERPRRDTPLMESGRDGGQAAAGVWVSQSMW